MFLNHLQDRTSMKKKKAQEYVVAVDTHWQANWGQGSVRPGPMVHSLRGFPTPLDTAQARMRPLQTFHIVALSKICLSFPDLISHENYDDDDVGEQSGVTLGADCSLDPCW